MTITARVIEDSIGAKSPRLTTLQLKYPRFIHAELMTHRVFSRNASSSRAIPVEKMIQNILDDTAMPIHWGKNQPGMQAHEEQDALVFGSCGYLDMVGSTREEAWCEARDRAIEIATDFHNAGYHKQIVNRLLEPFMHIDVIVTATDYENFFWLRRHPDAQPEIKALADAMFKAMEASTPKLLSSDEWHLPYVTVTERAFVNSAENTIFSSVPTRTEDLIKASVARCARVSYLTHDGKSPSAHADMALYTRLVGSEPLHASPAEHQARPDQQIWSTFDTPIWENPHLSGNFEPGWIQYRKTLPGEHRRVEKG